MAVWLRLQCGSFPGISEFRSGDISSEEVQRYLGGTIRSKQPLISVHSFCRRTLLPLIPVLAGAHSMMFSYFGKHLPLSLSCCRDLKLHSDFKSQDGL